MDSHFRTSVQMLLRESIEPFLTPAGNNRPQGSLSGNVPPKTIEQFNQMLRDEAAPYRIDVWDLDQIELEDLIANANRLYGRVYGPWVTFDLAPDAPPAVVAWQKEARASALGNKS